MAHLHEACTDCGQSGECLHQNRGTVENCPDVKAWADDNDEDNGE